MHIERIETDIPAETDSERRLSDPSNAPGCDLTANHHGVSLEREGHLSGYAAMVSLCDSERLCTGGKRPERARGWCCAIFDVEAVIGWCC